MPAEATIRGALFLGVFLLFAAWEVIAPRRRDIVRRSRWPVNLGLAVVNALLVRLIAPAAGVTFAVWAAGNGWGLLPRLPWPIGLEAVLAIVALDAAVYAQHRIFHAVPWLWKLHRLHHADGGFDVTTGVRFNPLEILVSTLFKGACIVALGASPVATLIFEVLLNASSMFSHTNGRLRGDGIIRALVVTPDMHRVHHSVDPIEHNSNFGFNLSIWDRLFGTYRPAPAMPHESMPIGLRD